MKKILIIVIIVISFFAALFFQSHINTSIRNTQALRPLKAWKDTLKEVGFKGVVCDRGMHNFTERQLYRIKLKNAEIENKDGIPINCDLFFIENNKINLVAYSQNVNRWDKYGLEIGDIMEKKVDSDTIMVYKSDGSPKYLFELFDGILYEWLPRELPNNPTPLGARF